MKSFLIHLHSSMNLVKQILGKTPDKYFVDSTQLGEGGLKEYFEEQELIEPFNKNS